MREPEAEEGDVDDDDGIAGWEDGAGICAAVEEEDLLRFLPTAVAVDSNPIRLLTCPCDAASKQSVLRNKMDLWIVRSRCCAFMLAEYYSACIVWMEGRGD
jgi:hypothetical protein